MLHNLFFIFYFYSLSPNLISREILNSKIEVSLDILEKLNKINTDKVEPLTSILNQTLRSRIYSRVEKTVKEIRVNNVKFS